MANWFCSVFNVVCVVCWWPDGNTNIEGIPIDSLLSALDLNQIICEPTNFEEKKNPSCIDLIFFDQPNIIVVCDHPLIHSVNIKLHISTSTLTCHQLHQI